MVVKIEQIREDGLTLDEPISADFLSDALREGWAAGFRVLVGSQLSASLYKVSGGVLVRGRFETVAVAPCKRCLADVEVRVPVAFTLNLVPRVRGEPTEAGEREADGKPEIAGSFRLEEADEELFDGRTIDLDPILREQMLLALPMVVVCNEDCRGLCPGCGADLNDGQCSCEPKTIDPRLSALKHIKVN